MRISKVIIKEVDFQKLLQKSNLTITQLSRLSGLTTQSIYNVLNDKVVMTEENWNRLKIHLSVAPGVKSTPKKQEITSYSGNDVG